MLLQAITIGDRLYEIEKNVQLLLAKPPSPLAMLEVGDPIASVIRTEDSAR